VDPRDWLVLSLKRSDGCKWLVWYATACRGYTNSLIDAGRYSAAEAVSCEGDGVTLAVRLADVRPHVTGQIGVKNTAAVVGRLRRLARRRHHTEAGPMPTTTRTYTPEQQAETVSRYRALAENVAVAEIDTPAGEFTVRNTPAGYELTGRGLRLFGVTDPFGPSVRLTAVDDADAVASARRLILDRWRIEGEQMAAAFGFDSMAGAVETSLV
jgi:hypothetical protein